MNLQEQTNRIKQVMGILNEENPDALFSIGHVDWRDRNEDAKEWVIYTMETQRKVPSKYFPIIKGLLPNIKEPFFISLLNDINKGSLSQKTINDLKSHFIIGLQKALKNQIVVDGVKKLPAKAISVAKSFVFKPILNHNVDKYLNELSNEYLIKGLLNSVIDYADETDKRILANSKKVINHLSSSISNDDKLKNDIHNLVSSFMSKI